MKVGLIGVGAVGAASALAMVERGVCRELVLVDKNARRARGVAQDLSYSEPLAPAVDVVCAGYDGLAGASLVVITAGVNEKTGGATDRSDPQGRLRLLDTNAEVYREIVPQVVKAAPDALLMVVTDPPDPLADLTRELAGHDRVFSTGTLLDSLRFRVHVGRHLNLRPRDVDALVVGEHGTSEVLLWSSARVAGVPVLRLLEGCGRPVEEIRDQIEHEIRYANISIIEGTGASQYGIGAVTARLAEIVLRDERAVLPVAAYNPDFGVTLSLVGVLGGRGVGQVWLPEMSDAERQALEASAEQLRKARSRALAA